jgi:hypothetical protein
MCWYYREKVGLWEDGVSVQWKWKHPEPLADLGLYKIAEDVFRQIKFYDPTLINFVRSDQEFHQPPFGMKSNTGLADI